MPTSGPTRRDVFAGAAAGALIVSTSARAGAEDLTDLSIAEAGRRIATRSLSPAALTEAYLDRIERLQPKLNAFITITKESALKEAQVAEREIAAGTYRGILHGIPIALKDNIDTAGVRTTAASAVYANRVPSEDAAVVTKLKRAGAVFLGKLNMHEFAYGGTTAVSAAGPTHNPWNLEYNPGGSSGGSGAAVAARMCAGALGTDTAASIRLPAAFCGVVGLKATHGLASIRGIVPLSDTHDHVGPLCRSVEDCALMMAVIAGYDPLDAMSVHDDTPSYSAVAVSVPHMRIGVARSPYWEELNPDVAAACEAALKQLGGMVASVRDVEVKYPDTFPQLIADAYAYHEKMVTDEKTRRLYDPNTLVRIMDGADVKTSAYIECRRQMQIARNMVNTTLFADVDVVVTPTCMVLPRKIADVLAHQISDLPLLRNTLPYDVLGSPAISVPCGVSSEGLPIGLQIAGPRFGEMKVIALARAFERAAEWHTLRPPVVA